MVLDVEVVVVHHLVPHASARLPKAVVGRGGIQVHGEIELLEYRQDLVLEVTQALQIALDRLGIVLQADAGLVGEDDDEVSATSARGKTYRHGSHPSS